MGGAMGPPATAEQLARLEAIRHTLENTKIASADECEGLLTELRDLASQVAPDLLAAGYLTPWEESLRDWRRGEELYHLAGGCRDAATLLAMLYRVLPTHTQGVWDADVIATEDWYERNAPGLDVFRLLERLKDGGEPEVRQTLTAYFH